MYRLIIAEDEPIECRALEHKIQELVEEVTLLPSVYDGLSLLKSVEKDHPDIAIVDINMPGLSGLEAIELLRAKKIELKIIVNTSYSDFAYIQKALQLGASDFLLKPGNKNTLAEAVRKVCRELDDERKERTEREKNQGVVESLYQVASEKWLLSLLLRNPDENCYSLLETNCSEVGNGGVFTAWKIVVPGEKKILPNQTEIKKFLMEQIDQFCHCMGIVYDGLIYIFLMGSKQATEDEEWDFLCEIIEYGWENLTKSGYETYVGVGRYKETVSCYVSGLDEARVSILDKEKPGISFFRYRINEKRKNLLEGMAYSGAKLLVEGKKNLCVSMVQETLEKAKLIDYEDIDVLRVQVAAYFMELEQEVVKLTGRDERCVSEILMWESFNETITLPKIIIWLQNGIDKCSKCLLAGDKEENSYLTRAMIYIYENYDKDISLDDAARTIGISSFYLSRLFKQEKNVTFVEILTNIRIQKAVQLLKENQLPMRKICQMTGYSSITYFYRVFKKTTGFTVGTMKKYL